MARVLFVAQHLSPLDARFSKMRSSLLQAGFAVDAVAPALGDVHPDVQPIESNSNLSALFGRPGHFIDARIMRSAVVRAAVQTNPDVIIVFDPEALPAACAAKVKTGARLIYDAHEFHEEEAPDNLARGRWVKKAEMEAAKFIDAFVTVNGSIADLYADARPDFPPALVVHNAALAGPAFASEGRLRNAAGLDPDAKILLYHGALRSMRGLHKLIAAAALLPAPWRMVMMGEGPLREELSILSKNGLVPILPSVPQQELLSWISDATLGAILYEDLGRNQHYATPNKLFEYPQAGVPVLASDLPEMRKFVEGAQMGWLAPPDATPAMIAEIVGGVDDKALSEAAKGARRFADAWNWENEVGPLIDTVRKHSN